MSDDHRFTTVAGRRVARASAEACAECGAPVHRQPGDPQARLCRGHLRAAIAASPPFVDGTQVTPGTEGCRCDGPCPECPSGKPRKDCSICDGYGMLCCETPCWQRLGLTSEPCCPGCPPLEEPEPEPRADVIPIPNKRSTHLSGFPVDSRVHKAGPRCVNTRAHGKQEGGS